MTKLIVVPYTDGLVDYNGEDPSLFIHTGLFIAIGIVCDYSGDSPHWVPYVDPRPRIVITDITSLDPSFFYDASSGLVSVKANVEVVVSASISNFDTAMKWNTPLYRNKALEGFALTETDGGGTLTILISFPFTGLWEMNNKTINEGVAYNDMFLFETPIIAKVTTN